MGRYMQGTINLSIAENAKAMLADFAHDPGGNQFLWTDLRSFVEFRQVAHVDCREIFPKRFVAETPFRKPAMQRHLAAFESALPLTARTRPHTLLAAAGSLAVAAAGTASNSFRLVR
jgi:hypothetical protein